MRLEPGPFKTSSPGDFDVQQSWRRVGVCELSEWGVWSGQAAVSEAGFLMVGSLVLSLEETWLWQVR